MPAWSGEVLQVPGDRVETPQHEQQTYTHKLPHQAPALQRAEHRCVGEGRYGTLGSGLEDPIRKSPWGACSILDSSPRSTLRAASAALRHPSARTCRAAPESPWRGTRSDMRSQCAPGSLNGPEGEMSSTGSSRGRWWRGPPIVARRSVKPHSRPEPSRDDGV